MEGSSDDCHVPSWVIVTGRLVIQQQLITDCKRLGLLVAVAFMQPLWVR